MSDQYAAVTVKLATICEAMQACGMWQTQPHLGDAIDVWVSHWNHDPPPFVWTKTVDVTFLRRPAV